MKATLNSKTHFWSKFTLLHLFCMLSFISNANDDQTIQRLFYNEKFWLDRIPTRYYSNILIELRGNVTHDDSLIFKDYIIQLNEAIEVWDVSLSSGITSNLVFEINVSENSGRVNNISKSYMTDYEYLKNKVILNIPDSLDFTAKRKLIHFYLFKSISGFQTRNKYNSLEGSVFNEDTHQKIQFNSIDIQFIKYFYSKQKDDQYKNSRRTNQFAPWLYYQYSYLITNLLAIVVAFLFLIWQFQKGWFRHHQYRFLTFFRQGLIILAVIVSYSFMNFFFEFLRKPYSNVVAKFTNSTVIFILTGSAAILLIYLLEKLMNKEKNRDNTNMVGPILVTAIIPLLLFVAVSEFELNGREGAQLLSQYYMIGVMVAFIRSVYISVENRSFVIIRKKDLELAQMSELHKQAELQSLRAKINPHFLYNALNSIASLATTDASKTEQMALALSDFFKYAINREQKQLNTLSEELNAIRTYLEIEKVRFGDRLSFEIECVPELLDILIPQLLIQPLVENAIKHGLSQITENGLIRIFVNKAETQLKIRVYDNGPAFPEGPLTGFGIQNTQERIALLYGAKAKINWQNGKEKYVEVSIPVVPELVKKH